jgi:hypothetical protein
VQGTVLFIGALPTARHRISVPKQRQYQSFISIVCEEVLSAVDFFPASSCSLAGSLTEATKLRTSRRAAVWRAPFMEATKLRAASRLAAVRRRWSSSDGTKARSTDSCSLCAANEAQRADELRSGTGGSLADGRRESRRATALPRSDEDE